MYNTWKGIQAPTVQLYTAINTRGSKYSTTKNTSKCHRLVICKMWANHDHFQVKNSTTMTHTHTHTYAQTRCTYVHTRDTNGQTYHSAWCPHLHLWPTTCTAVDLVRCSCFVSAPQAGARDDQLPQILPSSTFFKWRAHSGGSRYHNSHSNYSE